MYYNDGLDVPEIFDIKKREEEEKIRRMKLRREAVYKEIKRQKEKIAVGFGIIVVVATSIFQINQNKVNASYVVEEPSYTYSDYASNDNSVLTPEQSKTEIEAIEETEAFESDAEGVILEDDLDEIVSVGKNYLKVRSIDRYKDTVDYKYFKSAASDFGIDVNLLLALGMTESSLDHYSAIPGGSRYNGFGVGMMQLETPSSDTVYAFNCNTNKKEALVCSMDAACDIRLNTRLAAMKLQNALNHNNGNIYLAIQEYNFGYGMMKNILNKMSEETGLSVEEIKSNYRDLSFMKYVEDAHNNPSKYISGWRSSTYGNGKYLYDVLKNCPNSSIKLTYNGETFDFNLASGVRVNDNRTK